MVCIVKIFVTVKFYYEIINRNHFTSKDYFFVFVPICAFYLSDDESAMLLKHVL